MVMDEDSEIDEDVAMPPLPKILPRQQRFIEEYLIDLKGTQAAFRAGYGSMRGCRQRSYELLRKPQIAAAISEALAKGPGITRARIIDELARIAFSDIAEYTTWGPGGIIGKGSDELTPEQTSVVAEVFQEPGKSPRVKLYDKVAALEKLCRALGMFKDQHEHTGKDGAELVPVINLTYGVAQPPSSSETG
jgi:phage terminase small subunit